jgi:hypothetical protein
MQEMQEKPPAHVLSFGAGVNSVALMVVLLERKYPLDEVVFADTGAEVPETYAYVEMAGEYLRRAGVPMTVVRPTARAVGLYETAWRRRVIPSAIWRWSTRDFKVGPLARHYRQRYSSVAQYLGIAFDEIERMKPSSVANVENVYPLVELRITRKECLTLIAAAGLPTPVKSGCFFCPFNSLDRWRWLHETHPDLFERAIALEERSKHYPRQRLTDQVFRGRATMPLRELRQAFSEGKPLRRSQAREVPCGGECLT